MFENLTEGFERFVRHLRGQGKITPQNVKETLREVRKILLEADVSLPVVKTFLDNVNAKSIGQEVLDSITPGQQMVKIIYDEMVKILGGDQEPLHFGKSPSSVLIVGLNGSGKTTTAAKLALHLKKK
ncbi:MAG: signal recognition particle receptor subunit alpha, partial [bacterium]